MSSGEWLNEIAQLRILALTALAMLLGAAIGFERELEEKPAGLRTHMLVAGTSALFVALAKVAIISFSQDLGIELVRSDPIRIIQSVLTGISFLGAGTIIRRETGRGIEGLTTAASILFTAALGTCVALDQLVLAIGATVLALFTLRGLGLIEGHLQQRRRK